MEGIIWDIKQKWQKLTRGYSDEELWNLDSTICEWLLPRLKSFKEKTILEIENATDRKAKTEFLPKGKFLP